MQPSNSFVLSKQMLKQTKAQVMESNSNYTVIKPQQQQNHQNSEKMLEEYMSKLNKMEEKSNGIASKKIPVTVQQAPEVPDFKPKKSESSDNVLTNEFMRVREEKFGKVLTQEVEKENQKNLAKSAKVQHQQRMNSTTSNSSSNCKRNYRLVLTFNMSICFG